jgi:hypothetical protein
VTTYVSNPLERVLQNDCVAEVGAALSAFDAAADAYVRGFKERHFDDLGERAQRLVNAACELVFTINVWEGIRRSEDQSPRRRKLIDWLFATSRSPSGSAPSPSGQNNAPAGRITYGKGIQARARRVAFMMPPFFGDADAAGQLDFRGPYKCETGNQRIKTVARI